MLGTYTFIPVKDAGVLIKFMKNGRVLAVSTAYDDKAYAEITARVLLRQFNQFDGVLISPYRHGQELPERRSKEARREMKRAYKEASAEGLV